MEIKKRKIGRPPIFKKGAMTSTERTRRYRRRQKRLHPSAKTLRKQEHRAERERQLAAAIRRAAETLGTKLFGVLYVDPPWDFLVRDRTTGMDRHAANHYPVMSLDELAALKLPAAEDCVLYLWTTVSHIAHAIDLIRAWGFEQKSGHGWRKPREGTGYWVRDNLELLLIATKGRPVAPAFGEQEATLIEAPQGEHSEKPDIFAEMIERLYPSTPKLEMFARGPRLGWDVWGNESIS
jgi:N6-adenosine-specific RNA methylase IME4